MTRITQSIIDQAIQYLRQGYSRRHIRLVLMPGMISDPTLKKYCGEVQDYENKKRRNEFCDLVQIRYEKEKRISCLAKELGTTPDLILGALRERGIPQVDVLKSNQNARKNPVNENYFETIDSSEKAYYLGLMYADGVVHMREKPCKNIVKISLKEEDGYILDMLNDHTNFGRPLKRYAYPDGRGKPALIWNVNSRKMCLDLISHGCVQRKSAIIEWPKIEEEFLSVFLRGMFDGDGSMGFYRGNSLMISLTTSHPFASAFSKFYEERFEGSCNIVDCGNYCELHLNRVEAKIRFYHYLYGDKRMPVHLKRKKANIDSYIDNRATKGYHYTKIDL